MAKEQWYKMPNIDRATTNVDEYVEAWQQLARPVEQAFNLQLSGFDPDFMFIEEDGVRSRTISLPLWFVKKLNEVLLNKENSDAQ